MTWSEHLYKLYTGLRPVKLPEGFEWLYPYESEEVREVFKRFLYKYYNDDKERTLMIGINPGRFGAGVTGVNFTAPRQLKEQCGIEHNFKPQSELSAEFIYEMINAYGGPKAFYSRYFIGSVCPLGFVKNGKNINYYDDPGLLRAVKPFIVKSMNELTGFHVNRSKCICIGGEKNLKHLSAFNTENRWFNSISSVPHPRFIMQYRRKQVKEYVEAYLKELG
jgi:hypothetical protein